MIAELAEHTRISKYALYRKDLGRRETWDEQVDRVMGMHREFFGEKLIPIMYLFDEVDDRLRGKEILGSQRSLQFGGAPILRKNARIFNCWGSRCDRPRVFQEMFHILLCGGGTGMNMHTNHVKRLPDITNPWREEQVYVIPDTIEGWADAAGVLLSSYFVTDQPFPEWAGTKVKFDGSLIREKGAPLSSGSKAPGPEPLLRALELVRALLDDVLAFKTTAKLRPIHTFDIAMYLSDAVLSGGVRRSASLITFDKNDVEMMSAKSEKEWWKKHPQRQRANISAIFLRSEVALGEFESMVQHTRYSGDPGIELLEDIGEAQNPCSEAGFWPSLEVEEIEGLQEFYKLLPLGSSSGVRISADSTSFPGWSECNCSTVVVTATMTEADFIDRCRAAAVIGTLQAAYTDLGYLGGITELIVRKEALLGVSITGMADNPKLAFNPRVLRAGAAEVLRVNELVAKAIGINPSARATFLKPEGTGSLMVGTLAHGVHTRKHRMGIKHVEAQVDEPTLLHWQKYNPHAVFRLLPTDRNYERTVKIAFAYEAPAGATIQKDITALEMLRRVRVVKKNWVDAGRVVERCVKPFVSHNVSNTVDVAPHEWDEVIKYIYDNRDDFVGVSLLPTGSDKLYHLAPYTEIRPYSELIEEYGSEAVTLALDLVMTCPGDVWRMVDDVVNDVPNAPMSGKWDAKFIKLAELLARKDSTITAMFPKAGNLVKDVELFERWHALLAKTVKVPWEEMLEEEDVIDYTQTGACGPNGCDIDWDALTGEASK